MTQNANEAKKSRSFAEQSVFASSITSSLVILGKKYFNQVKSVDNKSWQIGIMFRKIRLSFNAENDNENQNFVIFCNFGKGALPLQLSTVYFSHISYIQDQIRKCIHILKLLIVISKGCW